MRQAQGLIYISALCLVIVCARKKPAMAIITEASHIAVLAADNAWNNYRDALWRAGTATCPKMRLLLDSVARASLEQFCRKVDQHPAMLPYHLAQSGHWLDKRKG